METIKKATGIAIIFIVIGIYIGKLIFGLPSDFQLPENKVNVTYKNFELTIFNAKSTIRDMSLFKLDPSIITVIQTKYDTIKVPPNIRFAENDTTLTFSDTLRIQDTTLTASGELKVNTKYFFPPYNFFAYKFKPKIPFIVYTKYVPIRIKKNMLDRIGIGLTGSWGTPLYKFEPTAFIGIGIQYNFFTIGDIINPLKRIF